VRVGDVGVLTLHRCINHGSYWQARCLVEALRARGLDAVILDHRARRIDVLEWRCALQPTLPTAVPRLDRRAYARKIRSFAREIEMLPLSQPFDLENTSGLDQFRSVVVGSDEVWNVRHPFYAGQTLFFGHGLEHAQLMSYAASFGNYDAGYGLDVVRAEWLRRFAAISVRDDNSHALITAAVGVDPPIVLDPCLQFSPRAQRPWRGGDAPFVAVYGHNFSTAFSTRVREWADRRGLRLVSVSYRNGWADEQWLDAGPIEFAQCMERADAVVTNFFHGAVFALRFTKPFVVETSPYRTNKVLSLVRAVGAEAHVYLEDAPATTDVLEEPVAHHIISRIGDLRKQSDAFLDGALAAAA
jgi:hypothetical protein